MGTFHRRNDFYTVQNTHHKKKTKTKKHSAISLFSHKVNIYWCYILVGPHSVGNTRYTHTHTHTHGYRDQLEQSITYIAFE